MYSDSNLLEFMLFTWSGNFTFAFVIIVVFIILEYLSRWLKRNLWPWAEESDEHLYDFESKEYKDFIEAEMERLQRNQEKAGIKGPIGGLGKGHIEIRERNGALYNHLEAPKPKALKKEPKYRGVAAETIRGWRRHPDFFRPLPPSPAPKPVRRCAPKPTRFKREPASEGGNSFKFRNPKYALADPIFLSSTPDRRIKLEETSPPVLASPFSGVSGSSSSIGYYSTPSPMSTIATSPHSYWDSSSTLESSFPVFPSPGDAVFRRRPVHLILQGTVDETDLWDGPFTVLSTTLHQWVELLLPQGSRTSAWTELEDIVLAEDEEIPALGAGVIKDGIKLYIIDKLRGVKDKGCREEKYLVHWKGWGSEDDTWEPKEAIADEYIREFESRARNWVQAKKALMAMRIEVEFAGTRKR